MGGEVLDSRFILIAVGAVPMHLGVLGEEHLITSTDFLQLAQLPKKIVLLGFIAAEFAHIAARAGARVTVLEQMDRMLTPFDPDLGARPSFSIFGRRGAHHAGKKCHRWIG